MTHVAFVCDIPEYQQLLPQVIMVTKKLVGVSAVEELRHTCPKNVYIHHGQSAWINADVLVEIIALLALIFEPLRDELDVIFLVDTCSCHLARKVFASARFHGIGLCGVAARLTWLLQPLDTHVFNKEKEALKQEYTQLASICETSDVPVKKWLAAIVRTIGTLFAQTKLCRSFCEERV